MSVACPAKPCKDDFHLERSRFLDAFAGLEEALLRQPDALKDQKLADEVKSLRLVRNDLVHSKLRFIQLEGQLQVVAINAQNAASLARQGRLLKIDEFARLSAEIAGVKKSFKALAAT